MSDSIVRFVPANPDFVPNRAAEGAARKWAKRVFPRAEVHAETTDAIQFVDPGENMGEVHCPRCSASLGEWWPEAMDAAAESEFRELEVNVPCCGAHVRLDDLQYEQPIAFSRFVLGVENPEREPTENEARELESILGTPIRVVFARY